jgi:hypothetical protein
VGWPSRIDVSFAALPFRIDGAQSAFVSDRDGVTILRVHKAGEADPDAVDSAQAQAATFATACDQALKSGLGKTSSSVAFYDNRTVVHINALPLVISLVLDTDGNVGHVLQLANDLLHVVEPLRLQIQRVETQLGSQ